LNGVYNNNTTSIFNYKMVFTIFKYWTALIFFTNTPLIMLD
jgi:hypothetical protein